MNVKYKSEQNTKAADLLLRESKETDDYYMAVIHCAYYSCVQLIKYVLCNNCKIDYDIQQKSSEKYKYGSHIYLLNTIKNNMYTKSISARDIRFVGKTFIKLKKLRKKADYLDEKIIKNNAEIAIQMSNNLNININNIYN